jgi:Coenzyme PQQ synthesis protein D (PqqD)
LISHPDKHITFHPFADGGVLHRTGSHRLWVLNVTAATLWCLIDGQSDDAGLARDYGALFGIDGNTARGDVTTLLAQFNQWGLLNGGALEEALNGEGEQPLQPLQVEKKLAEDIAGLPCMTFALAGHCFTITFSDLALALEWKALLGHLAGNDKPDENCTTLAVLQDVADPARRFFCYENSICTEGGLTRNQVVPYLIYKLFENRMAGLQHRLLFHAAVVAKEGQAVLLPAQSGSGKSTLSAALTASGWTYLSDELALVNPETRCVEPFALPIGLKDKSMDALTAFIPDVEALPRHMRIDAIGVRYHRPPKVQPKGCLPIRALVYPQYSHDAATQVTELKPLESLEGLAETGSSSRPLITSDIAAMLKLASLPSFSLRFSDLKNAVNQLKSIKF